MRTLFLVLVVLSLLSPAAATAGTIPPLPVVQMVYVYQDEPDLPDLTPYMAGVDAIFMASSGGARRVRWAGPTVYQFRPGGSISPGEPGRKYLLFLDWETVGCAGAGVLDDDRPGQENRSNVEGGYGWLGRSCWSAENAAHELVHLLGGVQNSAPHASGGHHCTDGWDLMCYSDPPVYPSLTYPCGLGQVAVLDCGGDDYFNVEPRAGSYLVDHWNVADSAYLVRLGRVLLPVVGK